MTKTNGCYIVKSAKSELVMSDEHKTYDEACKAVADIRKFREDIGMEIPDIYIIRRFVSKTYEDGWLMEENTREVVIAIVKAES